jgi:hypothetical protein
MSELSRWFDSVETDKPFKTCKVCDLPLPLAADVWVVNKHYHRSECVLEYAVCESCRDHVSEKFSESSKAAIRRFLETEIEWEQRMLDWMALDRPVERMDQCVACRLPREQMDGFTISAQFNKEGNLIEGALPLLMCASCISQINAGLSEESRKIWQDFIAEFFEGPDTGESNLGFF